MTRFGLWYDFRNPADWRRPFADLYAATFEQIRYAEQLGYDNGKIDLVPDDFIASGSRVVVLAHSIATSVTGADYNNDYAMLFEVRDGLIASVREYLDTALVETAVFGKELRQP
ncbi:MAG: hypothetical protein ABIQ47_05890 [Tepidiformaceae bacterium]